jgi:hypothetical protein
LVNIVVPKLGFVRQLAQYPNQAIFSIESLKKVIPSFTKRNDMLAVAVKLHAFLSPTVIRGEWSASPFDGITS